jgi:hypothetical protein
MELSGQLHDPAILARLTLLYRRQRSPQSRSGLPEKVKNHLLGIKLPFFGHPVRSLSLYRLNYPLPRITALSYVFASASLSERQCKQIELLS